MRISRPAHSYWPILASAGLYFCAFPPLNLFLLVLVALVPWLLYLKNTSPGGAFRSGLLFGALFWLTQMGWLLPFVHRWTGSYLLAIIPWLLIPIFCAWYFAFVGWAIQRCYSHNRVYLIPLVWAGVEVIRSFIPALAFPYGLLATPLWQIQTFVQHAAFGTIFLVSAWVMLINVAVAEMMVIAPARRVLAMFLVAALFGAGSAQRYLHPPQGIKKRVTIGQIGVDMAFGEPTTRQKQLESATRDLIISGLIQQTDLLVFPEGITHGGAIIPPHAPFGQPPPLPLLFGGQRWKNGKAFQSAYGFDPVQEPDLKWQVVDKTRLVIFGEYVPFRDHIPLLSKFDLPQGDLTPGDKIATIDYKDLKVGPMLCFESLFPDIPQLQAAKGAQLLAVLSNDDWYNGTTAPQNLMANSVWRSIENGLPLVRCASTGYSLACDSRGNILAMAPRYQQVGLYSELNIPASSDAFPHRGLFPWMAALSVLWPITETAMLQRRKRAVAAPSDK